MAEFWSVSHVKKATAQTGSDESCPKLKVTRCDPLSLVTRPSKATPTASFCLTLPHSVQADQFNPLHAAQLPDPTFVAYEDSGTWRVPAEVILKVSSNDWRM